VAAVARAGPHRRVKDDEMVAHYAPISDRATDVIPIGQLAERVVIALPQPSILRTNTAPATAAFVYLTEVVLKSAEVSKGSWYVNHGRSKALP